MAAPHPDETCPECGLTYGELRTGYCYGDVFGMLWSTSSDPADWRYKRRHTVLGLWMSIKRDLWAAHLAQCSWYAEQVRELQDLGEIPYDDQPTKYEPDDYIPW